MPMLAAKKDSRSVIAKNQNKALQGMPPMTNGSAITGMLAATYSILWTTAVITFPHTIEKGVILVVIIISNVCRSFSPEMDDAVRIGTTRPRMTICVTANTG